MRCFISIELTDEIKSKLARLIENLKEGYPSIKWVKPENLHLTLKFLGDVSEDKIEAIAKIIEESKKNIQSFFIVIHRFKN